VTDCCKDCTYIVIVRLSRPSDVFFWFNAAGYPRTRWDSLRMISMIPQTGLSMETPHFDRPPFGIPNEATLKLGRAIAYCVFQGVMRVTRITKETTVLDEHYTPGAGGSSWWNSEFVCALADTHRHLGHLIKKERWHGYDATHSDEALKGFNYLGAFVDLAAAKLAVELAVWGMPTDQEPLGAEPGFIN
jgi:hypothetical protein